MKLKTGQIIEIKGSNSKYLILELWNGFESGRKDLPVIFGKIQRLKRNGQVVKSEKPIQEILQFNY